MQFRRIPGCPKARTDHSPALQPFLHWQAKFNNRRNVKADNSPSSQLILYWYIIFNTGQNIEYILSLLFMHKRKITIFLYLYHRAFKSVFFFIAKLKYEFYDLHTKLLFNQLNNIANNKQKTFKQTLNYSPTV